MTCFSAPFGFIDIAVHFKGVKPHPSLQCKWKLTMQNIQAFIFLETNTAIPAIFLQNDKKTTK